MAEQKKWDSKMVAKRMEETAETMHRLPETRVQGYVSSWPEVLRQFCEAYGYDTPKVRMGPPTGEAIDRMDECLNWLRWLEPEQMRLVWLRAERVPWKIILRRLGVSRATAWQWWMSALLQVATRLNTQTDHKCLNNSV